MIRRLFCFVVLALYFQDLSLAAPALGIPAMGRGFTESLSPGAAAMLGALSDFKDAPLIRGGSSIDWGFRGGSAIASKLDKELPKPIMPHEAFPTNHKLSEIASQEAVWLAQNKALEPLSADNYEFWAPYGAKYGELDLAEKNQLGDWAETYTKISKEKGQIAKRINWSLEHSSRNKIWWDSKFVKGKTLEEEARRWKLVEIGDLLHFGKTDPGYKLTDADINSLLPKIYEILSKGAPNRNTPLIKIAEFARATDDVGHPLYPQRAEEVFKYLTMKVFPRQSEADQIKSLETMYLMGGEAPKDAAVYAPSAVKVLQGLDYRAFMPNPARANFKSMTEWLTRSKQGIRQRL